VWPALLVGTGGLLIGSAALLVVHASLPIVALAAIAAIVGIPNGLNIVANQNALYAQAPAEQTGSASGLFRTSQYVGAIASASIIAITFGSRATDRALHDLAAILVPVAAVLLVGTLADRRLRPRGRQGRRRRP
jgi:hypothetical protein